MERRKVLFIGPTIANIYQDIIDELERQNYDVDFHEYKSFKKDPHNLKGHVKYGKLFVPAKKFDRYIEQYWTRLLGENQYNKSYDYLFVLDGDSLHECIFKILKSRNKNIRTINYLFDSTRSNYEFNINFHLFDDVYSFDTEDCLKYNIKLLPIFWKQSNEYNGQSIDFFGLGSYLEDRYILYEKLSRYSQTNNFNSYIKIYCPKITFDFKRKAKKRIIELLGYNSYMIPRNRYESELITHEVMSSKEYLEYISRSKVVIDTVAHHQNGLTARFMWALGAGKKIITNNASVREYNFYDEDRIYIVENVKCFEPTDSFRRFCDKEYIYDEEARERVKQYRIDNWIRQMFEK